METNPHRRLSDQPGLEVVQHPEVLNGTYIQAVHPQQYQQQYPVQSPQQRHDDPEKHATWRSQPVPGQHYYAPYATPPPGALESSEGKASGAAAQTGWRKRRSLWIGLGAVLVLVVVGAVVGGVVGSRGGKGSNITPTPTGTPSPSSSGGGGNGTTTGGGGGGNGTASVPSPKSIRATNSPLFITGTRSSSQQGQWLARLFWQGPDDLLRFLDFDSSFGAWAMAGPTVLGATALGGGRGSLAGGVAGWFPPGQFELFYTTPTSLIAGLNFRTGVTPSTGSIDDITTLKQSVASTSTSASSSAPATPFGAYWPSVVFSNADGSLGEIFYNFSSPGFRASAFSAAGSALPGSPVLVLPASADFAIFPFSSVRTIYRPPQGTKAGLVELVRQGSGAVTLRNSPLPVTVSAGSAVSAVGGLAFPRQGDASATKLDTVVVYVLAGGAAAPTVQFVWQDDDASGWKGPGTDSAFEGIAAAGSQVACLVPGVDGTPRTDGTSPMGTGTDSNRCYFQVEGGAVREVKWLGGGKWSIVQTVPIP